MNAYKTNSNIVINNTTYLIKTHDNLIKPTLTKHN